MIDNITEKQLLCVKGKKFMGEYYKWVNPDKKEYICPACFDYGSKHGETMHKDSTPLLALHTLLSNEWKDCHIIWLGDEVDKPLDTNNYVLKLLDKHSIDFGYPHDVFDTICESYKNVSALFKEAEEDSKNEIDAYIYDIKNGIDAVNEYDIDINNPYDGLFLKTGRRYKYVINHTKKVYYSLEETDIVWNDGKKTTEVDPLPELLGFGRMLDLGDWVGDVIGVSDDKPDGYKLIDKIMLDI